MLPGMSLNGDRAGRAANEQKITTVLDEAMLITQCTSDDQFAIPIVVLKPRASAGIEGHAGFSIADSAFTCSQ